MARILPSAQKEIALIAGLARMTVPRMLCQLRILGTLIDVNGGVLQWLDLESLRRGA